MKKLIAIILIITTFLAMTSCDKKDDKEENLDKENVVLYEEKKYYYTHYTAPIRDDITELPTKPRFLNTYEEFVELSTQYTSDKLGGFENIIEHTKLESITEQTFKDYFIVAVLDPGHQHQNIELLDRRTYSGFAVYNNTIEFCVKSYYSTYMDPCIEQVFALDFVLVPRKLYSEDLKEKQINLYAESYYGHSRNMCYECYQYNTDGTQEDILIYEYFDWWEDL